MENKSPQDHTHNTDIKSKKAIYIEQSESVNITQTGNLNVYLYLGFLFLIPTLLTIVFLLYNLSVGYIFPAPSYEELIEQKTTDTNNNQDSTKLTPSDVETNQDSTQPTPNRRPDAATNPALQDTSPKIIGPAFYYLQIYRAWLYPNDPVLYIDGEKYGMLTQNPQVIKVPYLGKIRTMELRADTISLSSQIKEGSQVLPNDTLIRRDDQDF